MRKKRRDRQGRYSRDCYLKVKDEDAVLRISKILSGCKSGGQNRNVGISTF